MGIMVGLVNTRSNTTLKNSIHEAVNLIDFNIHKQINSVIIKPNLCYYWDASTGYTTDPEVVGGIIDWVRDEYGSDVDIKIVESDATSMRTKLSFKMLGYEKIAKEKDVKLHNLSENPVITKKVYVEDHEIKFNISKLLLESDLFINVPKLKIARLTKITCAMKNIFGCISDRRKIKYHSYINQAIVGINKLLKPHLTIVDGIVGLGSEPIRLNLLISSNDSFSADCVASQLMGYKPLSVDFLKIAVKENLGSIEGIDLIGEAMEPYQKIFPKLGVLSTESSWPVQIWLLRMYAKIVNDIVPPILEY